MNLELFMDELARVFDKTPKPEQLGVYREKLRRFSPEQLLEILNSVLEECKYYPKVSEIFKAAQLLGYLSVDTTRTKPHTWQPTDCGTCHGEGRLAIYWAVFFEERPTGRVEVQQLAKIIQYSEASSYEQSKHEFRTIWRCKCLAADATTIPKSWPQLKRDTPLKREIWG